MTGAAFTSDGGLTWFYEEQQRAFPCAPVCVHNRPVDFAREIDEIGTFLTRAGLSVTCGEPSGLHEPHNAVLRRSLGHDVQIECPSESLTLDLALDLVTTPADVKALGELRAEVSSWFALTSDEIDAILPETALDRWPTARAEWEPFSLA